ncbi:MAG: MCE family protein [Micromonosporaceae bacterium]|nr:MCE family protein [Micromonosporaceae bacterium]
MKPIRERNPVLVGAVGLAVLAGLLVVAFNIDHLPLLGGDGYRAAFRDASGLVPGNEVRVAGVKVGSVTGVDLVQSGGSTYVRVSFRVTDGDVRLGRDTEATIRIKTVLGQKYLGLAPAGPDRLRPGEQIPLSHTASPLDVVQAVNGLADTLQQIDTDQLAQAFRALTRTFANTSTSVSTSLQGLAKLSTSVASRDAELRELLSHAHDVAGVLAARDDQLRRLVADGDLLLAEVSARRDAIHQLLVTTDDLATQLTGLVREDRTRLAGALAQLQRVLDVLRRNSSNLERTIATMAPFITAFTNVLGNGRWFDSYIDGLLQPYVPRSGS